jgi:hypothetical protein
MTLPPTASLEVVVERLVLRVDGRDEHEPGVITQ